MDLNSQAWRNSVEEKEWLDAWMRVWMPHLRTHVRANRGARRKGSKKLTGCSRAVGQMFKQTSNYLNSIWDLRGVPALRKYRPPSPTSVAYLGSPESPCVPSVSFLLSFLEAPAEDVVGRAPRKKHKTCISFAARVESRFPFMSCRFRLATLSVSSPLSPLSVSFI